MQIMIHLPSGSIRRRIAGTIPGNHLRSDGPTMPA
jgi:hypothetical protein